MDTFLGNVTGRDFGSSSDQLPDHGLSNTARSDRNDDALPFNRSTRASSLLASRPLFHYVRELFKNERVYLHVGQFYARPVVLVAAT